LLGGAFLGGAILAWGDAVESASRDCTGLAWGLRLSRGEIWGTRPTWCTAKPEPKQSRAIAIRVGMEVPWAGVAWDGWVDLAFPD
jgi:hypothetical protein